MKECWRLHFIIKTHEGGLLCFIWRLYFLTLKHITVAHIKVMWYMIMKGHNPFLSHMSQLTLKPFIKTKLCGEAWRLKVVVGYMKSLVVG